MECVGAIHQTSGLRIVVVPRSEGCAFGPKIHHFVLVNAQRIVTILSDNFGSACTGKVVRGI